MFLFELKFLLQSWFSLNADFKDHTYSPSPLDLSLLLWFIVCSSPRPYCWQLRCLLENFQFNSTLRATQDAAFKT